MRKQPVLTIVGAGPGDPDLISLKGIKALQKADVVLYDALVSRELLKYAIHARKIFVGKRAGSHEKTQEEINRMIVKLAGEHGHVVRLKGGDPFVFGRGSEELEYAGRSGLKTFLIPGISSAVSVPALAGIPLTKRGVSESFWVMTGTRRDGSLGSDLEQAAVSGATVVILMGFARLKEIRDVIIRSGRAAIPAAVIENGSMPFQKMVIGTASDIYEKATDAKLKPPVIIVFGEVVRESDKLKMIYA